MFSIGFRSGLSGGVGHQLMPISSKKSEIYSLLCLGSLSWYNRWPVGNSSFIKGSQPPSKILLSRITFIFPVNITTLVAPFLEVPPQM